MKTKKDPLQEFIKFVTKYTTWEYLTKSEKSKFLRIIKSKSFETKGSYKERLTVLNNYYTIFLKGLGYTLYGWRQELKK